MRVGLVTWEGLPALSDDDRPLLQALEARGVRAAPVVWSDRSGVTAAYDAVVLRSTWDYHRRLPAFLDWLEATARQTPVFNPAPVVRWNSHKGYLRDLERAGVPVVPTVWGSDVTSLTDTLASRGWEEAVLKPAVSASAEGAYRVHAGDRERNEALWRREQARGDLMVQPYLRSVEDPGEHSLVFLDAEYSHAAVRAPALAPGSGLCDGVPVTPSSAERSVALAAVRASPRPPLYARVDLVADESGAPRVSELELIEPLLYLASEPQAVGRFASAIARRVASTAPP